MTQATQTELATTDSQERRYGAMQVSPGQGLRLGTMQQAIEFAQLMAKSKTAIPAYLRDNPGGCMAITIQAYEWEINPFALANKSYSVNDRLAYESALYHAVVQKRAPIRGRIKMAYAGEGMTRTCRVWAALADEDGSVEYTSPTIHNIKPKNSPLWVNDPDQQLFYYSIRAFARRHFPDVMMGIVTTEELQDAGELVPAQPAAPQPSRTAVVAAKVLEVTTRRAGSGATAQGQASVADQVVVGSEVASGPKEVGPDVSGEIIDQPTESELQSNGVAPAPEVKDATAGQQTSADAPAADVTQPANGFHAFIKQCQGVAEEVGGYHDIEAYDRALNAAMRLADQDKKKQLTERGRAAVLDQIRNHSGAFAPRT